VKLFKRLLAELDPLTALWLVIGIAAIVGWALGGSS
jgi:hypothetical protein